MLYQFQTPKEYEDFITQYTTGAFSTLDMEIFIPEVKKIKSGGTYLEIGVDKGLSLGVALFAARKNVNVVGVDISDTQERQAFFKTLGLTNYATFIHGESARVAKIWQKPIDVLFIDGNHSYDGCSMDIRSWAHFVPINGVILFHDCDESSPGVVKAVNEAFPGKVQLFKTPKKNTSMAKIKL